MYYFSVCHQNDIAGIPLSKMEMDYLKNSNMNEPRKKEWSAGRRLLRRLINESFLYSDPVSIINDPDGSPVVKEGPPYFVSLSHENRYLAAIVSKTRKTAVDLCSYDFSGRLENILSSFRITSKTADPVQKWVSLECLVKLRKQSLLELREVHLNMELVNRSISVSGAGEPFFVNIVNHKSLLLGYVVE